MPIAWDMRSHSYDFGLACELTEREILDGEFTHDGDPRLYRHVANARRRPNRWGSVSIGKESASSPNKIDLAVCMIGARMVRRQVLATKKWKRLSSRGSGRAVVMR
jgi:phage terminase large subunit-like protein